ncbi:LLM class flavin-dependent oxidoreductase [Puniceibacterium sediminis]|uniref:Pyrimidine oxygenase n=1 Tax=Puniceibacterium sediminis TaxID=1608407 RepID=A0A238X315_9RHOB|nr:LLM class flavin-dependent oxidoreductase [Puniceibacterium sediminis]SNR53385.1 pyrimidine oxygenase [Puniceibacterium sediminis]
MSRLDLGLFIPSTSGSLIIAKGKPPQSVPTWELNKKVAQYADEAGMDFLIAQVKWRGYGGETGHWDSALEAFTLMSGLGAVTKNIKLVASVAVRTLNPAVVAKMAATAHDICGGRFVVNVVAGWNKFEYAQMGLWSDDDYYLNRYEYADEYLTILKRLWTEDHVTFKGEHFEIEDCVSNPKPAKMPEIVCAGQSDAALAFVARQSDYSFIGRLNDTPEQLGETVRKISGMAAEHGREVKSLTLLTVIAAETEEEAMAEKQRYINNRDSVAIEEWQRASGMDRNRADYKELPPEVSTFMSIPHVVGSYQQVAEHLDKLAEQGVSGACLAFPDFAADVPKFCENVMPLMTSR